MKPHSLRLVASLAALACTLSAACQEAPIAVVRLPADLASAPRYGDGIFPSDAYLDDGRVGRIDGLERVAPLGSEIVSAHLETLDGFGLRPVVEVFVDGPLDAASVPAESASLTAPLFVIDVDPGSRARGRVVRMQWRVDEARERVAGVPYPGEVLAEGTRYAVVVTDGLRDERGTPLTPPEPLRALLDQGADALPERWRSTRTALDAAVSLGVERARVVGFAAFTTQRASAPLVAARTRLVEGAPAPALSFPDEELIFRGPERLAALLGTPARDDDGAERWGWSNETGVAHEGVGVIATGLMTAPRFVSPPTGTGLPGDDTFALDDDGAPRVLEPRAFVPVTFVLPSAPPPLAGYPVVLVGHGLGASRHQVLAFAAPLAARGFALAAIDMDGHGSRFNDEDDENNNAERLSAFTGDAALRDGFGDVTGMGSVFALLHELENTSAIRDSVRQSALDLCSLATVLRASDLDLAPLGPPDGPTPRLDAARVAYLGESYGGVVGAVFAALEPGVDLFVLDVPGGGIIDLALLGSPTLRGMVELWVSSAYGVDERLDRFHPLVGMAQAVLDGADPLTYAPHVLHDRFVVAGERLGPRHLVVLEVVGDEVVPNRATHALARAARLPILAPFALEVASLPRVSGEVSGNVDGQTAALVQWSPATHGANWTSERGTRQYLPFGEGDDEEYELLAQAVPIPNPMRATLEQVLGLLESHGSGEAPTLEPTHVSALDFDADGTLDDDEVAAGRDPYDPNG